VVRVAPVAEHLAQSATPRTLLPEPFELAKLFQLPASPPAPKAAASALASGAPLAPARPDAAAGSSGAAAPGPGFGIGAIAALIALFLLAAPRVGRRLRLDVGLARPPTLVSLLERPG
jgi:hypothetical protein